jgi:hypothetical protein
MTTVLPDGEIDVAILNALAQTDAELVSWAVLRQRIPGDIQRQGEAFVRLWTEGRIWATKIQGRNFVALASIH